MVPPETIYGHICFATKVTKHCHEMEVNAAFFIIAATEPLCDVLCGAFYFLALYPDMREKLRIELEACVGVDGVLSMAATARSPYVHAVINESMRLYPPIPGGMRRVTPQEGHTISGTHLPSDVSIPRCNWPILPMPRTHYYCAYPLVLTSQLPH